MKKFGSEFKNKFHLLYSQESSQKIIWSSSDSSDYENVHHKENIVYRKHTSNSRKRKRRSDRNKQKNSFNLDIVYAEDKQKGTINGGKSPIMKIKSSPRLSPILSKQHKCSTNKLQKSPILSIPQELNSQKSIKSPILMAKTISPVQSSSIRKKLFVCKERLLFHNVEDNRYDGCDSSNPQNIKETSDKLTNVKSESNNSDIGLINEQVNRQTNAELVKRVRSYFDNHFNSQTSTHNSISEYESTPQSCTITDEIDIISLTDDNEKSNSDIISSKDSSLDTDDTKTSKTLKLNKYGLAYRLNSLLKKQNASISMWQNEKFLASSSKFSLPKSDFTVFRIQNVQLKYGCYLLDAKDVDNISYNIIINILHVNNVNLEANVLLKLYKPYDCLTIDNSNVILNVLKFECDNYYKLK